LVANSFPVMAVQKHKNWLGFAKAIDRRLLPLFIENSVQCSINTATCDAEYFTIDIRKDR